MGICVGAGHADGAGSAPCWESYSCVRYGLVGYSAVLAVGTMRNAHRVGICTGSVIGQPRLARRVVEARRVRGTSGSGDVCMGCMHQISIFHPLDARACVHA